jgi:hypothetical protein
LENKIFPELLQKKENNQMINLTEYTRELVLESLSQSESVENILHTFACLNQELAATAPEETIDPIKHYD